MLVRLVLVLGLALLTLPLLDASATADTTTDPAASATTDPAAGQPSSDPSAQPSAQPAAQPAAQPSAQPSATTSTAATATTAPRRTTTLTRTATTLQAATTDVCTQGGSVDSFMQYSNKDINGPGVWANGNMNAAKANLVEGGFVWQRVVLKSLKAGPQQLVLSYDVKDGNLWAYDYLAQFSLSTGSDLVVSVANQNGPVATATITWTMPAAGGTTLIFGAHIASELDHGPNSGAGTINGSPYHVSLQSLNCTTTGQMDNQIMASAVQSALLTVVKVAHPADGTDFHFAITPGGDASTFLLDDDNNTDATYPNTVTYRVPPGSYTVAETAIPAEWHLTDVTCTLGGTRTGDAVNLTLADDDTTTCTFTNTKTTYQDLTVSGNVRASYARDYDWTIDKSVRGAATRTVADGGTAQVGYDVTVTPSAAKDSDFTLRGSITLTNPNPVTMSGVNLAASVPGATCAVDGVTGPFDVAPGAHTYSYSCTMPPGTTSSTAGTSTLTATWSAADYYGTTGSASSGAAFDFGAVTPTTTDASVTVTDDHLDLGTLPGGNVVNAVDGPRTFSYTLPWSGPAGTCTPHANTATLTETDGDTQTDGATVTVCVGSDLTVSKNVVTGLHRTYTYRIDKTTSTPQLAADPATGRATAHYTVTVTDGAYADSQWTMTGAITVTNPNDWEAVTLSRLTDVYDGGGSCVVDTGAGLGVPAGGTRTFDYTCTFDSKPAYDGTNTATATWDASTYATPSGSAQGTRDVAAADWSTTMVNRTVTVLDDKTDPAHPVTLGQVTWAGAGTTHVFSYDLSLQGSPGRCTTYTNTASIAETGDSATADVSVCQAADLTVSKTVRASYDRTYLWQIDKAVDRTLVTTTDNGSARFGYTVTATPSGSLDSGWVMTGEITVSNPNQFESVTTDVTDVPDVGGGASCTVTDGQDVLVPPAHEYAGELVPGTNSRTYTCTFTSRPDYSGGSNTATATWDGGSATSGAVPVTFGLATETHKTVTVTDDKVSLDTSAVLGTATWNSEGTPTAFHYALTQDATPGRCVDYTNTAALPETGQSASTTATLCAQQGLTVTKTVDAGYDRTYHWQLAKVADKNAVEIADGGHADVHYTVSATPDGYTDSGWTMTGTITVANPNGPDVGAVTTTVTDVPHVGGGADCTVADGTDVVVPAGRSVTLDYSCTFTGQPQYTGGTNEAVATWTGPEGSRTASGSQDVTFRMMSETHRTVAVYDDKVSLTEPELLGTATWNDAGTPTTFEYDGTQTGVAGRCTDYVNTASIPEVEQTARATVTVCVEKGLVVSKTAQATYDRAYHWRIQKDVSEPSRSEVTDGAATFHYAVKAIPDGYTDSGWAMSGTITVTNPNTYEGGSVTAQVTDLPAVGGGAVCTVEGGSAVHLAPGASADLPYSCTFDGRPSYSDGINTAVADWQGPTGGRTASGTTPVQFTVDHETDRTVTVTDDKVSLDTPEVLGEATWNAGGVPTVFGYDLSFDGNAGTCTDYVNTATLRGDVPGEGADGATASATVTVCRQGGLVLGSTASASYDRTYAWSIDKTADPTRVRVDAVGKATVDYEVAATPGAATDSGWQLGGDLVVTNPNDYKPVTVSADITTDLGAGVDCAVDPGQDLTVQAGATSTVHYTCTVTDQPAYDGTATTTVTWDGGSTTLESPVTFGLDQETNRTVTVTDDKTVPGHVVTLGQATWNEAGTPTTFDYPLVLTAAVNECHQVTNTAEIVETAQTAQATVTVCGNDLGPSVVDVTPPNQVSGVETAVLAATGAPAGLGLWSTAGAVLLVLGGWLMVRSRRRDATDRR